MWLIRDVSINSSRPIVFPVNRSMIRLIPSVGASWASAWIIDVKGWMVRAHGDVTVQTTVLLTL
jgi:hypothetical protein